MPENRSPNSKVDFVPLSDARAKRNFSVGGFQMDTSKSPTAAVSNLGSKYSTQNLTFPRDVENPDKGIGNHGHYILFSINTQERARLRTSAIGSGGSRVDDPTQGANIPKYLKNWDVVSGTYKNVLAENEVAKRHNDNYGKIDAVSGGASNPHIAMREGKLPRSQVLDSRYEA